jgi:UPF0755 protein
MKIKKWIILLIVLSVSTSAWFGYDFYRKFYVPNINLTSEKTELLIPTDAGYEDVLKLLQQSGSVKNMQTLEWMARQMNYPNHVNPGRYILQPHMTNRELILLLRSAAQTPVMLTLNKFRSKETLAGFVSKKIETDSAELLMLLNNPLYLAKKGFNVDNIMVIFLHNTYELYWNTDAEEFMERMFKEYEKYWNEERTAKAAQHGLTPETATILASIVEEETNMKSEKPLIAGVYLNRLKKNMKLQADPTVRFAWNDFTIKRILFSHLAIDSRYNTYMYEGLPPGPICTPTSSSLDAVLKPASHDYYFFCAKEDFSGEHNFARTHAEHIQNARKYRDSLDVKNIF